MAWMFSLSRADRCTLVNLCLAIVGSTALVEANRRLKRPQSETGQPVESNPRKPSNWEIVQHGVAFGVGLTWLVTGVVRQSIREMNADTSRNRSIEASSYNSPLGELLGGSVLLGTLFAIINTDIENDGDDDEDEDDDDDDREGDGDDEDLTFSTTHLLHPMEDDSVGAERPTSGGTNPIIIRNDVMFTIRDAITSTTEFGFPDYSIFVEEQTNNDDEVGDNNNEDGQHVCAMTPLEVAVFDTTMPFDENVPLQ